MSKQHCTNHTTIHTEFLNRKNNQKRELKKKNKKAKLCEMQFPGSHLSLVVLKRDKTCIQITLHMSCNEKMRITAMLSTVLHGPLFLLGTLSNALMASMMNRSFNSDRRHAFFSNNGPVLQRDMSADCIMASDVLYIGTQKGNTLFSPIHCDICRGQDHENLPQLVGFGRRPGATDCSWPSGSVIPHFLNGWFTLTIPKLLLLLFSK